MKLIIVESPTKAKTLTRFLNGKGDYRIEASMGHVRDLPKGELGVDLEHNFTPKYIIPKDKQKRVTELKDAAKKAESIILATDPDREGEAIAWHIANILETHNMKHETRKAKTSTKKPDVSHVSGLVSQPQRIVFHEITKTAIDEALEHPRAIDLPLVDAQQARRVLDRLVGYKLSPLLWQKLSRRWLSAGRVQSVAVRLIVEREREIEKFEKQEFWTIEGDFLSHPGLDPGSRDNNHGAVKSSLRLRSGQAPEESRTQAPLSQNAELITRKALTAQLISKDGVKYEKTLTFDLFDGKYTTNSSAISDKQQAISIIDALSPPYTVSAVDKKEVRRSPAAPFTTSTLQQEAGRKLYFSAKKTMQVAQKLYEEGLISYHRTDSVNLSEKFIGEAREYIVNEFGKQYIPEKPKRYQTKSKVAQEAHEAIRPTNVHLLSAELKTQTSELNHDHIHLYDLIWKRAMASQAADAVFDSTTIGITSSNGYLFQASGSVIKFDGYLKLSDGQSEDVILPTVRVGQSLTLKEALPTQHFTNPPPRYSEASLVKTLEEKGIGRPSTYAPTISTIQDRQYVKKEEKKLLPTDLGKTVTDFLVQYFPHIIDLPFTATMEDNLDAIATGENKWEPVIRAFYEPFSKDLEGAYETAEKVVMPVEQIDEKCPTCGNPLVIRTGRYGKFIACSTFPKCRYTRQILTKIDMKCPRDGGDIVVKKTRRGKVFYGCSNYPTCTFAAWKKEDIK